MGALKDKELIHKSLRGDSTAFEQLVMKYQNEVYSLSYRLMGNEEDGYNAAQESMVEVHRSLSQFKGDVSFQAWVYRITIRVCLDELRRHGRRVRIGAEETLVTPNEPDSAGTELEGSEFEVFARCVQALLTQMAPEHRAAIVLKDMMRFSYDEVASILECSIGTVKSRLNRGRAVLRQKLANLNMQYPEALP